MFKPYWDKKKQNNLVVLGILAVTLLAVFLASGEWREVWNRAWERLWGSATIHWEKIPDGKQSNTEKLKNTQDTENKILDLVKDLQGTYGVYVEDLETGISFGINENQIFTAASLIKLPVFVAVYQEAEKGNFSLNTRYQILDTDRVSGAGSMYYAKSGTVYSYEKMLELMGRQSDNTAQNVFVKLLGAKKIQAIIDGLGMEKTSFAENETTPRDIGVFFRRMYGGDEGYGGRILDYLTDTIWEDRIPAGIPNEVRVAHKVGTDAGIVSDGGIVFGEKPFVLVIMSEGVKESEAKEVLPKVSSLIYADLNAERR